MLKKLITHMLAVRHPWRYIGFSELSELYTSTMLRSMGISVVGVFVPIYLHILGYSIISICLFMAGVFLSRMLFDIVAGYLIARIGPKHAIMFSNILQIISLALILLLSDVRLPLWTISVTWGASLSFFFIAYHVDFSKIMHKDHGGKELGYMTILERIGAALGPLAGGLVATFAGPKYTIMAAILLFMAATLPLFLSQEPTRLHQVLHFRGLSLRKLWRDALSYFAIGLDTSLSVSVWPLFAALTILTVNTYASVGIVTSFGIIAAIFSAHFIGTVVDKNKGKSLLQWSVVVNSLIHFVRPITSGFGGVLLVNGANETVSTGYRMPYYKGMYGRADELPGLRIVYIVLMEFVMNFGKALTWLIVAGLSTVLPVTSAMSATFVIVGVVSLLMLVQNFPALKRQRFAAT